MLITMPRTKTNSKKNVFYIYTYHLKNIKKSKSVRFVYLLKGRGAEKGIINSLKGRFLAPGCFIIPEKNNKEIVEIFHMWDIKFTAIKILLID